jgi:O-methyltransferase
MGIISKIFKKSFLDNKVTDSIINGRGNLTDSYPSDFTDEEKSIINSVKSLTMTSVERLVSLSRAVDYIVSNKVEGDIVECGVWRGGSMMLVAKKLIQANDLNRSIYLFDTFEGMSNPDDKDVSAIDNVRAEELLNKADKFAGSNVWCYSSLDEVKINIQKTRYDNSKTFFVKGKVEDTLPYAGLEKIAILRLDTDWYESTRHELETLYDKLVFGGVLIIDDYGHWEGCRKAVDEFITKRNLSIHLIRVDYTGRMAVKN